MALAIDASTPVVKGSAAVTGGVNTIVSNTFSPPAGSVIFACISASGGGSGTQQTISSFTDSLGGHLAWNPLVTSNAHSASLGGIASVYYAPCPSSQANMTVTANFGILTGDNNANDATILPVVCTGAATTQAGAANAVSSTSGTPSVPVAGTAVGSLILGVVLDWTANVTPTPNGGQTVTINGTSSVLGNSGNFVSMWTQIQTALSAGGSVTIGDSSPTATAFNMVGLEIQAAATASAGPFFVPSRMPLGA